MKQVLYIFLIATALCACNRTSRENCNESVLDIIDNASYGDTHASSTWANRKWEFFGKPGDDNYEALTNNISVSEFNDLAKLISEEFGEPTYDKLDFPEELIPDADTGTFWMAWKGNDMFYYWCSDTLVVSLSISDSSPNDIGYSYLYIDFSPYIPDISWKKGYYEKYIDSLRAANPHEIKLWSRKWFSSERHYKFANDLYYADSYETYFGLLNEFLPVGLPRNANEYDRYLASEVQIDSLLDFEAYFGSTADKYWYESYVAAYTQWNIQKFTDIQKATGLYSIEVDSAWHRHARALLVSVDSVVMDRPKCQGTISYMEHLRFVEDLDRDYLFSILDELYSAQRNVHHMPISDNAISAAFNDLRAHLKEHVSKEGFEDIDDCYVPLSERYAALDEDEESWNVLISSRNRFSRSLDRKQRKAYDNATNNLKRNKLFHLKNQYRYYSFVEASFQTVFLDYNCSDEELMSYNFQESYKAVYGEYKFFD